MDIVIPGNADPTLAIDTILIGFTRMAASKCAVPPHLQAMILVSKLPYQMNTLLSRREVSARQDAMTYLVG